MSKPRCDRPRPYSKTGKAVRFAPDVENGVRLLGSQPTKSALRLIDGFGKPTPRFPPGLAPDPPVKVSTPDFAFQLRDRRPDAPCPGEDEEDVLAQLIAEATLRRFPNAEVRSRCDKADGQPRVQTLGIWVLPPATDASDRGRDVGLQTIDLLFPEDEFGFAMNSSLIQRLVAASWYQQPKRLDHSGNPDPDGPVHLTGIDLRFTSPDTISLAVSGFDSTPWPDVSFTATVTERLSVDGSPNVACSTERDLDTDTGWHFFLAGLTLPFLPLSGFFFLEGVIAETREPSDQVQGVGCAAAPQFVPEILLPLQEGLETAIRLDFSYRRMNVTRGGIFTGGTYLPVERMPAVRIIGPAQRSAHFEGASLSQTFGIRTEDLRSPLSVQWSGDGVIEEPTARTTQVRFPIGGGRPGDVLRPSLRVTVSDADGLTATAEHVMELHLADLSDDLVPAICRVRPWLPQCRGL